MTDLVEFLLARIAEDVGGALIMPAHPTYADRVIDKVFILAECEAKRRIISDGSEWTQWDDGYDEHNRVLKLLVLPYADHPDYREEWRP